MIARFMDTKNEPLLSNPTIALSYLYATKTRQNVCVVFHLSLFKIQFKILLINLRLGN